MQRSHLTQRGHREPALLNWLTALPFKTSKPELLGKCQICLNSKNLPVICFTVKPTLNKPDGSKHGEPEWPGTLQAKGFIHARQMFLLKVRATSRLKYVQFVETDRNEKVGSGYQTLPLLDRNITRLESKSYRFNR